MLTLMLVRCNVRPICSAMHINLHPRQSTSHTDAVCWSDVVRGAGKFPLLLMLMLMRCSVRPICSAMPINLDRMNLDPRHKYSLVPCCCLFVRLHSTIESSKGLICAAHLLCNAHGPARHRYPAGGHVTICISRIVGRAGVQCVAHVLQHAHEPAPSHMMPCHYLLQQD